jgi:hypothetical protein
MSQPQTWLHFLTDSLGRSYVYQNGGVGQSAKPAWLQHGPDGWMENTIKYARNPNYHELFRTFTTPYKYVKDGAFITRYLKYRRGSQEKLFHVIHKLDKSFGGGWQHKLFYKGQVDMSRINDTDTSVTANIMEGGLSKFLAANENIEYSLDIDVPDAVIIKDDGLKLQQKASYLLTNGSLDNDLGGHIIELQLLGNENVSSVSATSEQRKATNNQTINLWRNESKFIETGVADTTITLNWDFNMLPVLADGVGAVFGTSLFLQVHALLDENTRYSIPGLPSGTNLQSVGGGDPLLLYNHKQHFTGSATFTVPANARLILYMSANNNRDLTFFTYDNDGTFDASYDYRHRTTFVKGLRPMYVAQKLLDKMTGGGYQLTSNYISSEWDNLIITSGDAIRGIPGAKLVTSWRSFFNSYNIPCNLSSGIRNQIMYIERKANAYQPTVQVDLGAVRDLSIDDAVEYQYGSIKVGYPNTDTEDINGRDEFNVTVTYTSKVETSSKVLDLVSTYKASMYEQELLRINLDGKTTTDDTNDNTVYFKHLESTPTTGGVGEPPVYYKYLRVVYTSFTGVIDPATAYNVELHPELCLKRHGNFIRGVFYWMDGTDLTREKSDKNDRVIIFAGPNKIVGNKTISVGSFDPALFIPLLFKVNGPMPDNLIDVMEAGPNGTFTFTYNGVQYSGFPLETGIQPVERPAQDTRLLCSPVTNILNLITISR